MNRAFYNGISGSKSYQYGIDSWANNIANISTNGYKANIPQFASLFSDKVASIQNSQTPIASDQGFGVRANSSAISLAQGAIEKTDRALDVAIMGEGWFGVQAKTGEGINFTRDGNFDYNRDGDLVTADGSYVMGTLLPEIKTGQLANITKTIPLGAIDTQEAIKLPLDLTLGAIATKNVSLHGNLGLKAVPQKFNTEIFTATGEKHSLAIRIEKDAVQPEGSGASWTLYATVSDGSGKTLFEATPSPLLFDSKGNIQSFTAPKIDNSGQNIALTLGGTFGSLVAIEGDLISKDIVKDGVAKGALLNYDFNSDGNLLANFDNGKSSVVGKIALYHFQNDQGLTKLGDNHFMASSNSGAPVFYTNKNGENILGSDLLPAALEKANTSAATALTELIILQRAFDANAKSITTGDQLIQAALKMVR